MALRLGRRWANLFERQAAKILDHYLLQTPAKQDSVQAVALGIDSIGVATNLSGPRSGGAVFRPVVQQSRVLPPLHHQQTAGLATSAAKQGVPPPGPKLGLSSLVLLAPCGITLYLGLWQLQRREQKIAMLAERQQKLAGDPVSLPELLASQGSESAPDLEFRRVELTGTYDVSRSIFVGPRVKSAPGGMTEKGFHVVTPLMPEDKRAPPVLVNRGWVPNDWTEPPGGETKVTVCGVVRGSDQPSQFVPPNAPEAGEWFFIDAPRMARETGIGDNALLIEATSDVGSRPGVARYPEPRDPLELAKFRIMPQDHLNYAMTWLTLFAAVSTMAYMRLFGRSSRRKQVVLKYKDGT